MEGENLVVGGCRERVMCTLNYRVVTSKFQKHSKTLKRILSKIHIHYINYYTHVTWAGAYLYGGGAKDRMKSTKMMKIAGPKPGEVNPSIHLMFSHNLAELDSLFLISSNYLCMFVLC